MICSCHDPSPARGRRWRGAPDEGRCASAGRRHPRWRSGPHPPCGHPLPCSARERGGSCMTLLPLAGEGGAKRRMRAGAPAPVVAAALRLLTFYSYCAYSPSARPAWGPGRDGGLGWGSSGGPAGLGKRTPGSRERNEGPGGIMTLAPRATGRQALPVSKRLAFCKNPAGRGRCTGAFDQPPSIPALGSARATLSGPREATTPEAAGTASSAIPHVPAPETIATSPVIFTSIRHPGESRDHLTRPDGPRRSPG